MKGKWLIPLIFIAVIVLWTASIYLQTGDFCLLQWVKGEHSGHVSEALNALFSGLAFAGIIIAILLQRKDLDVQQRELEQTREELRGQKEQLRMQNETFKLQQFEATFFQMLRFHNENATSIDIGESGISGRICFRLMYDEFKEEYQMKVQDLTQKDSIPMNELYFAFYNVYHSVLGHYFRTLYNIVKFVDRSDIDNKKFYVNLVRAQLSTYELLLLFYNCLSGLGRDKFKPLVKKYELLKHMDPKLVLDNSHSFEFASFFPH